MILRMLSAGILLSAAAGFAWAGDPEPPSLDAAREEPAPAEETPAPEADAAKAAAAIAAREKELEALRESARQAFAERRLEEAELYTQLARRVEEDIDRLREEKKGGAKEDPAPAKARWEVAALLTRFDNDLDLADGFGFGARLLSPVERHAFHLTWRHWSTEIPGPGSDASADVNAYLLGPSLEGEMERGAHWSLRPGLGIVHFADTDRNDAGPLASLELGVRRPLGDVLSWTFFGAADALRTRANQDHTHTNYNFSLGLALEGRF